MKSSEILSKAANIIEQEIIDYKGNKALGGCYAILLALGYSGKNAESYRQKAVFAQSYFEKYRPEWTLIYERIGLHWWPMGNNPERVKALRDAAKDALENGD